MPANATYKVSGYCQGARDQAAALIFNADSGGTRVFTVRNLVLREASPAPATATLYNIYRTIDAAGGDPVQLTPLDTAAASVPSQVEVATYARVAASGGYLHGRWLFPTTNVSLGLTTMGGYGPGTAFARMDTGNFFDHRGFTDTQNLVLREGEGIAFYNPSTTDNPSLTTWHLQGTLKIDSDYYTFCAPLSAAPNGQAGLSIFNQPQGAGTIVEVMSLSYSTPGNPTTLVALTDATNVRIGRVYGWEESVSGGEAITPVSFGGAPVPPQLQVLRNREWAPLYVGSCALRAVDGVTITDLGYPTTLSVAVFREIGTFRQHQQYVCNIMTTGGSAGTAITTPFQGSSSPFGPNSFHSDGPNGATTGVRLNPGEGLAIIVNNPTLYSSYYFEAEITHEPPQVSGTAPMGYSS